MSNDDMKVRLILETDGALKSAKTLRKEIQSTFNVDIGDKLEHDVDKALSRIKNNLKSVNIKLADAPEKVQEISNKLLELSQQIREGDFSKIGKFGGALGNLKTHLDSKGAQEYSRETRSIYDNFVSIYNAQREIQSIANSAVTAYREQANATKDTTTNATTAANAESNLGSKAAEGAKSAEDEAEALRNAGKAIDENAKKQQDFNAELKKAPEEAEASTDKLKKAVAKSPIAVNLDADISKMNIAELMQYMEQLRVKMQEIKKEWAQGQSSDALTTDFSKAFDQMERAKIKVNEYKASFKTVAPTIKSAMIKATSWINIASQAINLMQRAVNGVLNAFRRIAGVVRSVMKKVISIVKSAASTISQALTRGLSAFSKSADRAFSVKSLKRTFQMLTKYIFGVRSFFFLYRKIRAGIGEGLKNLVQFESEINETNHAITELRTSLLFMKNAWAAAFAPIINVVYPILVRFMDLLASVGNAIARFVAALTGQATVLQALRVSAGDYADSLKDAAGGAGKAADAQEELNDRLAAFDDLNVLGVDKDKDPTSGSGGGGGVGDLMPTPNEMFERIATPMTDLVKLVQEAWETSNAFRLGEFFASRLSDSLDDANAWLEGEGRNKVMKIATLIASFMDGVLSVDDLGDKFGTAIGNALVLAMDFVNTIITPNRMIKIGTQIADAFNSAIPIILPKLGKTIGNLFKSAIANAWAFLTTADFRSWGDSFAQAVNNFIAEMSSTVTITTAKGTTQWGAKIFGTGLTGWEMLGQNVTKVATGVFDFIQSVLENVDWHEVGRSIGEFLNSIEWSDIADGLGGTWEAINNAFAGVWKGLGEDKNLSKKLEPIARIIDTLGTSLERLLNAIDPETLERWLTAIPDWIETITDVTIALWTVLEPFFTFMVEHPDLVVTLVAIGEALKIIAGVLATVGSVANIVLAIQALTTAGGVAAAGGVATAAAGGAAAAATALLPAVSSAGTAAGAAAAEATVAGYLPAVSSASTQAAVEGAMTESLVGGAETAGAEAGAAAASAFSEGTVLGTSATSTAGALATWGVALTGIATAAHEAYGAGEAIGYMVDNAEQFEELDIGPLNAIAGGLHNIGDEFIEGATAIGDTFTDRGFVEGMATVRDGFLDMVGLGDVTGASERLEEWGETARYTASDTAEAFYTSSHGIDDAMANIEASAEAGTGILEALSDKSARAITNTINSGYQDMANYYARIGNESATAFDTFKTNAKDAIEKTAQSLDDVPEKFNNIKGAIDTQSVAMKDTMSSSFENIKQESVDSAKMIQDNFLLASDNIKNSFIESWAEIKKSISEGGDMFVALSDGMGNTVKSLLNAMINGINISITKPLQDISKSFNVLRTLDVNGARPFAGIPYLNIPPIPHLAQGAVIPPNKQFMAVLGDQTSGTNIEAPLDTIKAAVGEEFAPYADMIVNAVLQVVDAVNNKPVLSDRDIGKANARFTSQQKLIRGTSL